MKRIIAILLLLCMTAVAFAGCKNNKDADKAPSETQVSTEAPTVPETTYNLMFDAFSYNGIEYKLIFKSDDANTPDQKYSTINFVAHKGDKIKDVIGLHGFVDFEIEIVEDEFLGFMEYKCTPSETEDGTVITLYEKLSGDKLYSIDEILEKEIPEYNVAYVARFESIDDEYYAAYGY